jgi:prepilin-type N-terminal cleavage/methylation domain-containing protein
MMRQRGLTLIDMLVVLVIAAILGSYAAMKYTTAGDNTLWYQAQRLARDIRHVQVLSNTYGRSLQITSTSTGYSVSCVSGAAAPCTSSPIVDPATGESFNVTLSYGVTLSVSGQNPAAFDLQGRPLNGAAVATTATTYTLNSGTSTAAVAVAPVTGFVSVSP